MSMYGKNHYNKVISLQLIKINRKKKNSIGRHEKFSTFSETGKKNQEENITDKD